MSQQATIFLQMTSHQRFFHWAQRNELNGQSSYDILYTDMDYDCPAINSPGKLNIAKFGNNHEQIVWIFIDSNSFHIRELSNTIHHIELITGKKGVFINTRTGHIENTYKLSNCANYSNIDIGVVATNLQEIEKNRYDQNPNILIQDFPIGIEFGLYEQEILTFFYHYDSDLLSSDHIRQINDDVQINMVNHLLQFPSFQVVMVTNDKYMQKKLSELETRPFTHMNDVQSKLLILSSDLCIRYKSKYCN